jgi:hypothetical protein
MSFGKPMHRLVQFREPTLTEALADPIVQAVMAADGVDARELEAMLMGVIAAAPFVPATARDRSTEHAQALPR